MQKDQIYIRLAELVSRRERLLWRMDVAEIHDLHSGALELASYLVELASESGFQPGKLRPIGIQTYAEEADAKVVGFRYSHALLGNASTSLH